MTCSLRASMLVMDVLWPTASRRASRGMIAWRACALIRMGGRARSLLLRLLRLRGYEMTERVVGVVVAWRLLGG